jgi:small conductance mechanosensitive channel
MDSRIFMALSTVSEKTKEAEAFFSADNIKKVFSQVLDWSVDKLLQIVVAVVVYKIGKRVIKWLMKICSKALERAGFDVGVIKFINSVVKIGSYCVIFLVILDILGFQTASLIAVFGSAALAVSMSLQGSLSNFAGGILIMIFRPFKVGDYIISGSCEGTVSSIDMLYTKLKTADNRVIMMPNGTLSNSNIVNVGAEGVRRLDMQIGISYGSDVTKAKELLRDIVTNYPSVDKSREINVVVKSLDASCVTIETRAWVSQEAYWDTKFILFEKFKQVFDENGIEIPYNQLDVRVRQD